MFISRLTAISVAVLLSVASAHAADPIVGNDVPEPPAIDAAGRGIWGAIAYSAADGKRGIFWGADTRDAAESTAQKHCEKAGGSSCAIVTTFRNHRHWSDSDGSGFPYEHCAALATAQGPQTAKSSTPTISAAAGASFGAASGMTQTGADAAALSNCTGSSCRIVERICT